jgi:hypothetical protein
MLYLWHIFLLWVIEYPETALILDIITTLSVFGIIVFLAGLSYLNYRRNEHGE